MPSATATLNGTATQHSDTVATLMSQPMSHLSQTNDNTVAPATVPSDTFRDKLRQRRDMMLDLVATSDSRIATLSLRAGLVAVIVVNFTLSFAGIYDYANRAMGYGWMSPLAPIGIDGLTICAIAAMYRMRNAHWRIRAFTWFAYLIPTGCSIAANVAHASDRHQATVAVAGSATWPTLLSLAIHLSVVVSRHTERAKHNVAKKRPATATPATTPPRTATTVANVATPTAAEPPPASDTRTYAKRRVAEGATISDIHAELMSQQRGVARRTIERWTTDQRNTS
jgi:hypothetical protein